MQYLDKKAVEDYDQSEPFREGSDKPFLEQLFCECVERNATQSMKALIDAGVNPAIANDCYCSVIDYENDPTIGWTPYTHILTYGHPNTIQCLMEYGVRPSASTLSQVAKNLTGSE